MEMDAAELTHAYIQDEEKVAIPVTLWQQTMTLLLPSWLALDKEETSGFPPKVGRGGSKNYHTYNKVQNNFQIEWNTIDCCRIRSRCSGSVDGRKAVKPVSFGQEPQIG